jgi:hypothetical protein
MTSPCSDRPAQHICAGFRMSWARAIGIAAAGLLLAVLPQAVFSHSGGTPRLTAAPVGPYRVYAWTQPEPWRTGKVHVTVGVTQPVSDDALSAQVMEQPVASAVVTVTFRSELDPAQVVTVPGVHQAALSDVYFDAQTSLPTDGPWTVTVDVAAPDGGGQAAFSVDVLPARSINWILIAGAALVFAAALAFLGWRARSQAAQTPPVRPRRERAKKVSA